MSDKKNFAIIKTGGKQYKVSAGDTVQVEKLAAAEGEEIEISEVLMIGGEETKIGTPIVEGASVKGKVLSLVKDEKKIIFKKKRRKGYKLKKGHRQQLSEVLIESVNA